MIKDTSMDSAALRSIILAGQEGIGRSNLVPREATLPKAPGKVITITGARRCGKSSFMGLGMEALLAKGVDRQRIVSVNMEDDRLEDAHTTWEALLNAYRELYPDIPLSHVHFFLDEVQSIPRWERFILRLHEQERAQVMVSGSNAKMLAREIATNLRGRTLNVPLMPFSLRERLRLRGLELRPDLPRDRARLVNEMKDHLRWGGFPEVIGLGAVERTRLLQEYFDVMLFRDLLERYGILQPIILRHFLKRVLTSATKPMSVNRIDQDLRSAGFKTTKPLLYEWLDHAQAIHLVMRCDPFGAHVRERLSGYARYYAVDNGLLSAMSFNFQDEWGRLLENAVAIEAVRQGAAITYYRGTRECDFILLRQDRPWKAVQACWSLRDKETRERELAGLIEACQAMGFKKGLIITAEEQENFTKNGVRVAVRPFWDAPELLMG